MSKRLIRIFAPTVPNALPRLIDREMNVVLYNGHTVFGRLESYTSVELQLCDLRSHTHVIKLVEIEEIILDRQSTPGLVK